MFLYLIFFCFSRNSSPCGNIIISSSDSASYTALTFNMYDANIIKLQSGETFQQKIADAMTHVYAKYGLVLVLGGGDNGNIDLSGIDITIDWVYLFSVGSDARATIDFNDGQVANLSISGCTVTLVKEISLNHLEITPKHTLTNLNFAKCKYACLIHEIEFDSQEVTVTISQNSLSISEATSTLFDISPYNYEIFVYEIHPHALSQSSLVIEADASMSTYPNVEFVIDNPDSLVGDQILTITFRNWEGSNFNAKPIISIFTDVTCTFIDDPSNCQIQQYSLDRSKIIYQNPININEVYICIEYCPSKIYSSKERLIITTDSASGMYQYLRRINQEGTNHVHLFSPYDVGTRDSPIQFVGLKSFKNLYIAGEYFKEFSTTNTYPVFTLRVNENVVVQNMFVENCSIEAIGNSKMQVRNISMEKNGLIGGRINVNNAYVDLVQFTRSFDLITIDNLNLRIYLSSNAELIYDTHGWEFVDSANQTSYIIVLSSSFALASNSYFHIYGTGNHIVTLTLRRVDIKQIAGVHFSVYNGQNRNGVFLSKPLESSTTVIFSFSNTWTDARVVDTTLTFVSFENTNIIIDRSFAPSNFEIILPNNSSEGDFQITESSSNINENYTNEDKKNGSLVVNILLGILIPIIVMAISFLIIFYIRRMQKALNDKNPEEENDQLILDNQPQQ